ncbi:MAG: hypothetical protein JW822_01750 [Spirochaetales bacterium]|nr:hypothetical protein [Spirochaetales bacterium]
MKRFYIFLCLLLCITGFLNAQLVSDPNDTLYTWISIWEEKGYLNNLPPLRPYPIQLVKKLLQQVQEVGNEQEAELAGNYLQQIDVSLGDDIPDRSLPAPLNFAIENQTWTAFEEHRNDAMVSLILQGSICDLVSFSGRASWGGSVETDGFYGPEWMNIIDEAKSGGGNEMIFGMKAWAKNLGLGGMTVGSSDVYFQAGLMRSSFGPFFENGVVIGPQCPAAGHFSFNYIADWITVSSVMLVLHPRYYWDDVNHVIDSLSTIYEKYLVVHSYIFNPWDWFEFGILQSVVYGGRFNPVYLLPFAHMFYTQQLYGDDDSSFLGLYMKFRLPLNIQLKFMCYLDDFNTDTFFGTDGRSGPFSLDNAQNKVALQAGLTWAPDMDILKRIRVDYLMVTPYTYTHNENYEINYLSYTHVGEGVGTILEPNSDQITVNAFLQFAPWCNTTLQARFARHGNASEDEAHGDGSYYDDGFDDDTDQPTFIAPARFLTQDVIEYVFQLGCDLDFVFGLEWGELACGIGYLFEYVYNKDLIEGSEEFNHFVKLFLKLTL